ncbi:Dirigent protein 17 [Rhynchospora pubera]|uniref:Dirigent protein 17 n=1 Tax=Rhynchospora pubera TaxID=906938 RepID=A0AAV8C6P8_9POAL|nr:Dirigent protein 17 [Rhynchospora pubera]KAJ4795922.1 Dirigent protein 17 [Rhynchospora pubera]
MDMGSSAQQLVPSVSRITGEPAILIIGVPNSSQRGNTVDQISNKNLKPHPKLESESESESESENEFDPCFGEWLEGRKVRKLFGDAYYSGKVTHYNAEANWYRVEYEDGDMEDLEWHELEEALVPLDISIPLKNLAMKRSNWGLAISRSGKKRGRPRKDCSTSGTSTTGIVNGINDLMLVPVKVEYAEQPSLTSTRRGRKLKGNANSSTTAAKSEVNLASFSVKEETPAATKHSRRKMEANRRGVMKTAMAERQKRKEQQSQDS